jgi:hypothetical protein
LLDPSHSYYLPKPVLLQGKLYMCVAAGVSGAHPFKV